MKYAIDAIVKTVITPPQWIQHRTITAETANPVTTIAVSVIKGCESSSSKALMA